MQANLKKINSAKKSFKEQVALLEADFKKMESAFEDVKKHLDNVDEVQRLFDKHKLLIQSLSNPHFHVCFAGQYSTGKSTLVNKILKDFKAKLLPEGNSATTAFPTYIYKLQGGEERAEIFYLSMEEREELKKEYLKHLLKTLNTNPDLLEELNSLPINALKQRIKQLVDQGKSEEKMISRSFECLMNLMKFWNENVGGLQGHPDSIENVITIQERDPKSVVIKEVKLYLKDLPYDDSIVLIDLPGVGADNIRHELITKQFCMDSDTKAFVFVNTPKTTDAHALTELIAKIHNDKQSVKDAFWIINMWDKQSENEESDKDFIKKLRKRNIHVRDDRSYKIPAINDINNPNVEFNTAVNNLKTGLMNYLKDHAFEEFLTRARKAYQNIKIALLRSLDTVEIPENDHELLARTVNRKTNEIFKNWKQGNETILRQGFKSLKETLMRGEFEFIEEKEIQTIIEFLDNTFSKINVKDLIIRSSMDILNLDEPEWAEIMQELINTVNFGELIRNTLKKRFAEGILDSVNQPFESIIFSFVSNQSYTINLPLKVSNRIRQIVDSTYFEYRVEGLCDSVVMDYKKERLKFQSEFLGDKTKVLQKTVIFKFGDGAIDFFDAELDFDSLAREILNSVTDYNLTWVDQVNFAIHLLKIQALNYVEKKQSKINKLIQFSLENHYKNVKGDLEKVLNDDHFEEELRDTIYKAIYNSPMDGEIEDERARLIALRAFRDALAAA